jgi:hypothetical protein
MAVTVASYLYPAFVAALWAAMRRLRHPATLAPALFAAFVGTSFLMAPAAGGGHALAIAALCIALAIGTAALADSAKPRRDPEPPDDDDGGGGRRLRAPRTPGGGGTPEADWWGEFEAAFWGHVDTVDAARKP